MTTVYRALAEKHNVPLASVAIAFGLWPTAVTHAVIGWSVLENCGTTVFVCR